MNKKITIAHIMHDSIPFLSGYSIRGKYIVENQKTDGLNPFVITSPAQSKSDFREEINEIEYFRFPSDKINFIDKEILLRIPFFWRYFFRNKFKNHCISVLRQKDCDIIHAHEVFNVSQVAWKVSQIFQKKLIYELRGVVEDSDVANRRLRRNSFKYRFDKWEKVSVMKRADAVVVISENLKKYLIERGIKKEKIFVVPNGVDTNKFYPVPKDKELIKRHNLNGCLLLGYIGSIRKLEGLDLIINAFAKILKINFDIKLIIVGSGPEKKNLIELVTKNDMIKNIIFVDKVNHNDILRYYSVIDIFVLPRIRERVNELVTPLKPLEAMAAGKCLLVSDVGGLKELVRNDETGMFFHAEDVNHFIGNLAILVKSHEKRINLGSNARDWVCKSRKWDEIVKYYQDIYQFAVGDKG